MTRKVKTFFRVMINSLIPNTTYYHKIALTHFSFSLKYFVFLIVIVNILYCASLIAKYNPGKMILMLNSFSFNLNKLPNNFFITIKDGTLLTSLNRPYFLWLDFKNQKKLLSVVDESATPKKINEFNSLILLTPRELVVKNIKNQRSVPLILSLNYLGDIVVNRHNLTNLQIKINHLKAYLPFIYIIVILLLLIILPIISLITVFIYLIIANLISLIFNKIFFYNKIKFKKIFQISFHSVTLPLFIDYFLTFLNLKNNPTPLLFLFMLLIFNLTGMYETYFEKK